MENLSKKEKIIEYFTAFTLTFIGGFTDAYTLIYRGGIFSNMQTGNLVKFVIGLSNLKFEIIYLIPIIVFILGIIFEVLISKNKDRSVLTLIILSIVFIVSGLLPDSFTFNLISVSLLSFTGAMQFQAFRKCTGIYYTSTMCTNNMRLLSEGIVNHFRDKNDKKFIFFILIILMFSLGVLVSTLIGMLINLYTVIVLSVISLFLLVLKISNKEKKMEE